MVVRKFRIGGDFAGNRGIGLFDGDARAFQGSSNVHDGVVCLKVVGPTCAFVLYLVVYGIIGFAILAEPSRPHAIGCPQTSFPRQRSCPSALNSGTPPAGFALPTSSPGTSRPQSPHTCIKVPFFQSVIISRNIMACTLRIREGDAPAIM